MILSACSSYFEQLFINFNEPHQVVILKDTSFADIVAIIEFMYKGEINVSQVAAEGSEYSANMASASTHYTAPHRSMRCKADRSKVATRQMYCSDRSFKM